jgi:uncharacterized protein YigE (DUF2233 family)
MKIFKKISFIYILIFFCLPIYAIPVHWQKLASGLEYTQIPYKSNVFKGRFYAFRIDPKAYRLELSFANEFQQNLMLIKEFVYQNHALLGINGGFFSPEAKSLGLRVKNNSVVTPLKPISWWGVLFIKNNSPRIVAMREFSFNKNISFAIQRGPRLIVNGRIPKLKPGFDDRSAIGITRNGKIIIATSYNLPLTTQQLAEILLQPEQEGGLNCIDALNLDGGTSTQLYAKIGMFELNLSGYAPVADAVLLFPR